MFHILQIVESGCVILLYYDFRDHKSCTRNVPRQVRKGGYCKSGNSARAARQIFGFYNDLAKMRAERDFFKIRHVFSSRPARFRKIEMEFKIIYQVKMK